MGSVTRINTFSALSVSAPPALTQGISSVDTDISPAGVVSAEETLTHVPAESGPIANQSANEAYVIYQQPTEVASKPDHTANRSMIDKASVPEIVVFGRGREISLREVPQSTVMFDRAFIENSFAVELRDVVRFIPSGATDRPANGTYAMSVQSRGFDTTYVVNSQSPLNEYPGYDPAGLERIEVIQGPASVLYGAMEPGAVINLITKKPRAEIHFGAGIELGSYNTYRSTVDLGGPLSDRVRVRLNAAYDSRETFYDFWKRERVYLAPVIEVDITDRTQMTLEASYRKFTDENGVNDARYPVVGTVLPNPNGQIPRTFSPVQPGLGDWNQSVRQYSAALTHELNDNWTLSAYVDRQSVYAGGLFWFTNAFEPDLRTLKRLLFVFEPEPMHSIFSTASIAGEFQTGPIAHSLFSDVLDGFSLSGSVQYRDDIFPGTNEELKLPSYTRADFGIHYSFGESIEVNVQIKNAFDVEIWNALHETTAAPGEPRTVTAGIRFKM